MRLANFVFGGGYVLGAAVGAATLTAVGFGSPVLAVVLTAATAGNLVCAAGTLARAVFGHDDEQ